MFIAEGLSENGNAADDLALNQNNILQQRNGLAMDSSLLWELRLGPNVAQNETKLCKHDQEKPSTVWVR